MHRTDRRSLEERLGRFDDIFGQDGRGDRGGLAVGEELQER